MLRKLNKIKDQDGIFRWKIEMRMPPGSIRERLNTHFQATEAEAHAMFSELLAEKTRHRLGLPIKAGAAKKIPLGDACADYEKHQRTLGRVDRYITDLVREMGYLKKQ